MKTRSLLLLSRLNAVVVSLCRAFASASESESMKARKRKPRKLHDRSMNGAIIQRVNITFAGAADEEHTAAAYSGENQKGFSGYLHVHRGAQEESAAQGWQASQVRYLRYRVYSSKSKRDPL